MIIAGYGVLPALYFINTFHLHVLLFGDFFDEGVSLLLRKRWAEYFTVIVTASFIPLEIYELVKKSMR